MTLLYVLDVLLPLKPQTADEWVHYSKIESFTICLHASGMGSFR